MVAVAPEDMANELQGKEKKLTFQKSRQTYFKEMYNAD